MIILSMPPDSLRLRCPSPNSSQPIGAARLLLCRVVIAPLVCDHFRGLQIPENVEIRTASETEFFELMARVGGVVVPMRGGLLHSGGQQTFLNAMNMGKPVSVRHDWADDYIKHGVTGILSRPGAWAASGFLIHLESKFAAESTG